TGHAPLNKHLHCINKTNSSHCSHCPNVEETMHHLIFNCPFYTHKCHSLWAVLGRKASSISFLLTDISTTPHLVKYINATG
ncbi:hypothetical protein BDR06DRAFT_859816, partial [Suillus hirtellus]